MTKPANIPAIEETTKITWSEWLKYLDGIKAKDLSHKEIANQVYEKLKGTVANASWWAQSVAVAYEQHIGRRKPGQRNDGTYEVSVAKTMTGSMDEAMQAWLKYFDNRTEFEGAAITKPPATSQTDKRSHWGCGLEDGSRVNVDVSPKTNNKVLLSITHIKLSSQAQKDKWQAYWKTELQNL